MKDRAAGRLVSTLRNPRLKTSLKQALNAIGYDTSDWIRVMIYWEAFKFIGQLGPQSFDLPGISDGLQ